MKDSDELELFIFVIVPELLIVTPVPELKIPAVDPVIVPVLEFVIVALLPVKYRP